MKKFICGVMCLCLSMVSCFTWTEKRFWWGTEYYIQAHEITNFRLHLQDIFTKQGIIHQAGAVACGFIGGGIGAAVGEGVAVAQQVAMSLLTTDLERHSYMGHAIILSLPDVIQGWNIREQ